MRTILNIISRSPDEATREVISEQRKLADTHVEVIQLDNPAVDYDELIDKIFSADSIEVW